MRLKGYYGSPRITWEYLDCSMPLTFDQHSNCGYNCAYCFSQYQRGLGETADYYHKNYKAVNVERIKKIWSGEIKTGWSPIIKSGIPIQWGGLSDPFCPFEEDSRIGLELLKFFLDVKQPISFSSKSDLILRDERYFDLFKKAGNLWHYKASIITLDPEKSKIIEAGAPSPQRRIEVLKKLREAGTLTTWRLRPFILGITDRDLEEQIKIAAEVGCQSATTEFFCLESRSFGKKHVLENYKKISQVCGFNIIDFYRKNTPGAGLLRLNYTLKKPYIKRFINACKENNIAYFVSDAHHKEKSCSGSCCGLLDSNEHFKGYAKYQYTYLIQIAKKKGFVTISDAENASNEYEKEWRKNTVLEGNRNVAGEGRRRRGKMSMQDYFMYLWNRPEKQNSPQGYLEGILKAGGKDKDGNVIYFYDYKKSEI